MKKRAGFSLIEMIVVMFIFTILGGVVANVIVSSNQNYQLLEAQSVVQRDLNLGLDRFNRVMRSATKLLETTNTNVKVWGYPNVNDVAPSEINFFLTETKISYSVIAPTGSAPNYTYNPANAKTLTLVPRVTNTGAEPVFVYFDDTNAQLTSPVVMADVKAVEFRPLATDVKNSLTKPISATTRATLRNFKTNL